MQSSDSLYIWLLKWGRIMCIHAVVACVFSNLEVYMVKKCKFLRALGQLSLVVVLQCYQQDEACTQRASLQYIVIMVWQCLRTDIQFKALMKVVHTLLS